MNVLDTWRKLSRYPGGRWLFTRLICYKAPYFSSIKPMVQSLDAGTGVATMRHRRAISNHIGTVHAIAQCNLAELIGGIACDASMPRGMRWIPKGMQVEYLKKAMGTMTATARPLGEIKASDTGYALPFEVLTTNAAGEPVFRAVISMWVSPKG